VNQVELRVQNTGDFHFLSFETMHQVGAVKAKDVIARRQNQVAAQMLNAVGRTSIGSATHRLGLEHFLMRARERMNVQSTLAV